jgi:hypothetical protein
MGLRFEEDAFDYLLAQYGGHPLLTRQACSFTHRQALARNEPRPFRIGGAALRSEEEPRDLAMFELGNQILGMLKDWYLPEYQLLQALVDGETEYFRDALREMPEYTKHLQEYQLVTAEPPAIRVPFLKRYLTAPPAPVALAATAASTHELREPQAHTDEWAEIGLSRNALEIMLKRYIKRTLKAHLGPEQWIKPLLAVIPDNERKKLEGIAADEILNCRLLFPSLIQVIYSNWEMFKGLAYGPPDRVATRDQFKVLLEYVNAQRKDAHAKPVTTAELASFRIAVEAIQGVVARQLED